MKRKLLFLTGPQGLGIRVREKNTFKKVASKFTEEIWIRIWIRN
jgi:hypothetical protein